MIKTLSIVVVLALAALLLYAAVRPDTFSVQRSLRIQASAEKIHPLIADLHRFNSWNPYDRKDPNMKGHYRGPAAGPGAAYDFEGNSQVGKGSIEIVQVQAPRQVTMQLRMIEPMEGLNRVDFTLAPQGDATEVTWAMQGRSPFIARLVGVFVDMDAMIGRDFEAGLAGLKVLAEQP